MVLVGPSGSGKSTALRMLAGLEDVDDGGIWIGDRDVTYARPARPRRRHGLPELRALPVPDRRPEHRASRSRWRASSAASATVGSREVAELLGLTELLERKPGQLSGGQRQRVAMGRAIVREPLGLPDGRAALEPRREAPRPDARRHRRSPGAARRDDRLRHARPVRGDDARQPRRGAPRRPAPAMRAAARALRAAGERVRRRLHRLARDEPRSTCRSGTNGSIDLAGVGVPLPGEMRVGGERAWARDDSSSGSVPRRSALRATASPRASRRSRCSARTPTSSAPPRSAGAEARVTARADARDAPARGDAVRLAPQGRDVHLFDPVSGERLPS